MTGEESPPNPLAPPRRELDCHEIICPAKIGPYILQSSLGVGAFAEVRLALREDTGAFFACKVIPKKRLFHRGLSDQLTTEIQILESLIHPGLCMIHDLFTDTINCYIIMDLCEGGNLFNYIVSQTRLSPPDAQSIFRQLIVTLQYVHSQGIAHRDIKPENILLEPGNRIKIIDFGLSSRQTGTGPASDRLGSLLYVAPECLSPENVVDLFKADIWSCGIVLFTMLHGTVPWKKGTHQQLFAQIASGHVVIDEEVVPAHALDLLSKILKKEPSERISIEEMLKHEWLSDVPDVNIIKIHRRDSLPLLRCAATASAGPEVSPAVRTLIALGRAKSTKRPLAELLPPSASQGSVGLRLPRIRVPVPSLGPR
jgi:serine/threonine protein kinase